MGTGDWAARIRNSQFTIRNSPHLLVLGAILIAAAFLRLWQIDTIPPGFHFDESFEGLEAWRILTEPGYRPLFLEGNFGVPPLNAYANAVTFAIFRLFGGEAGPTAMRVTAAFFGILGVLAVYALGAEMRRHDDSLPPSFPLFAAGALAVMRWHIHFSRMGIEPIFVPLLWAGGMWLLLRGWRAGSWVAFAGAGLLMAATLYAYQSAWFIPLLALLTTAHLVWFQRTLLGQRWQGLLLAGGLALLAAAPLLLFFWQNPELLLHRPQQVTSSGGANAGFWPNLWATARMFGPFGMVGDLDPRRNLPGAAALNLWLALPFYAGLAVALWRGLRPVYGLLLVGLFGLAFPGLITDYAPHFHRILGVAAPTALLIGLGLSLPIAFAQRRGWGAGLRRATAAAGILLLLVGGVTSAQNYFVRWAGLPDLYYAFDEGLWAMGRWMASQPATTPIYLTPRTESHPTLAFALAVRGRTPPAAFDGRNVFPSRSGRARTGEQYVVIEHEDFRTRLLLPELFPNAATGRQWKDRRGELYAQVYSRPPGSWPKRPPKMAVSAPLGDGIRLLGYDLLPKQPRPGDTLYVQLHWAVDERPQNDWTVFLHLLGPAGASPGALAAGKDSPPGNGSLPTPRWQAGWLILDEYQIPLPQDLLAGSYGLEMGLYQTDGTRLPGKGAVRLGEVVIGQQP
ncbi:MAG: hypothetical protein KJZ86_09690 [Caldilineaceae bacterium]|nr:hypothetical protein [Caldilineaceae bacterium]